MGGCGWEDWSRGCCWALTVAQPMGERDGSGARLGFVGRGSGMPLPCCVVLAEWGGWMGCGGGLTVAQRWEEGAAGLAWGGGWAYSCGHLGEPVCHAGASSAGLGSAGLDMRGECAFASFFLTFRDVESGEVAFGDCASIYNAN
jgi:hypothetical protein